MKPAVGNIFTGAIKRRSCAMVLWSMLIFTFLGVTLSILISPFTLIGLGTPTSAGNIWELPLIFGIIAAVTGLYFGLLVLLIYSLAFRQKF